MVLVMAGRVLRPGVLGASFFRRYSGSISRSESLSPEFLLTSFLFIPYLTRRLPLNSRPNIRGSHTIRGFVWVGEGEGPKVFIVEHRT